MTTKAERDAGTELDRQDANKMLADSAKMIAKDPHSSIGVGYMLAGLTGAIETIDSKLNEILDRMEKG